MKKTYVIFFLFMLASCDVNTMSEIQQDNLEIADVDFPENQVITEETEEINPDNSEDSTETNKSEEQPIIIDSNMISPPMWLQESSPEPIEFCKIQDGVIEPGSRRGDTFNGVSQRGSVGFPLNKDRIPIVGEANIIAALVSFEDSPPPADLTPLTFLKPQLEQIEQWGDFWSQNTFRYTFQMVDYWVEVPMKSTDTKKYTNLEMAQLIINELPTDLDFYNADGIYVYWSPDSDMISKDIGLRGYDGQDVMTPDGKLPLFFWGGGQWHYEDSGGEQGLKKEVKREYMWAYWIHEMLHSQGLNLHAPGNGWPTGLGQNQYPNPNQFSAAISAWESFLLGWTKDSQVQCISMESLSNEQRVIITPQEIFGGERKMIVVPIDENNILVVESRRPLGYSENWSDDDTGLLVYKVNPNVVNLDDHSQGDCGNDPTYTKWSYYLYPDGKNQPENYCGSFSAAIVHQGEKVTFMGVEILLEYNANNLDYVIVNRI